MRLRSLLLVVGVLALGVSACGSSGTTSNAAPKLADPTAAAKPLVQRFFTLAQNKDVPALERFLSPAFQLERADGSGSNKADYLAHLPTSINKFTLTQFSASQAGAVLVVRYLAETEGSINGKPYTPGPAPRLTVFDWNGSAWQVAAHTNFNSLTG